MVEVEVESWNGKTLRGGHSEDPLQIHDFEKIVMTNLELKRLKIDIAVLQKTNSYQVTA